MVTANTIVISDREYQAPSTYANKPTSHSSHCPSLSSSNYHSNKLQHVHALYFQQHLATVDAVNTNNNNIFQSALLFLIILNG